MPAEQARHHRIHGDRGDRRAAPRARRSQQRERAPAIATTASGHEGAAPSSAASPHQVAHRRAGPAAQQPQRAVRGRHEVQQQAGGEPHDRPSSGPAASAQAITTSSTRSGVAPGSGSRADTATCSDHGAGRRAGQRPARARAAATRQPCEPVGDGRGRPDVASPDGDGRCGVGRRREHGVTRIGARDRRRRRPRCRARSVVDVGVDRAVRDERPGVLRHRGDGADGDAGDERATRREPKVTSGRPRPAGPAGRAAAAPAPRGPDR